MAGRSGRFEALWRFQIPEEIGERGIIRSSPSGTALILGLNSARLYGLSERRRVPPASAAARTIRCRRTSPTRIPEASTRWMFGVGYPTPVVPVTTMNCPTTVHAGEEAIR